MSAPVRGAAEDGHRSRRGVWEAVSFAGKGENLPLIFENYTVKVE